MEWNWIDYRSQRPTESKPYLISVKKTTSDRGDTLSFLYLSYYNHETTNWYKYDSFLDNPIGEVITDTVMGWINGTSVYLG